MEKKADSTKKIVIPVEKQMWQALRKISFDEEVSMSKLIRTAIQKIINKHEKAIDSKL